jgi:hypothetical protein
VRPDTDRAAAALDEAKRIADALHFACRLPDKTPDFTACGGPAAEAYWDYFTPARIRLLVGAIEAARAHHVEAVIEDMPEPRFRYCKTCSGHPEWPCPEVAAITAALTGTLQGEDGEHA